MPAGQPLSLECTVDGPWQYCRWSKDGAGMCEVEMDLSSEEETVDDYDYDDMPCTSDGRIKMTLSRPGDRTCSIRVDSATTDDEGEFSCLLGDAVSEADIQTMAVEVEEPADSSLIVSDRLYESR